MQPAFIVASDVDFTMIGLGNRLHGVPESVGMLSALGGLLILVTAKSIDETVRVARWLGLERLYAIVEAGGAVVADRGTLHSYDYTLDVEGRSIEVAELGARIEDIRPIVEEAANALRCRLGYITLDGPRVLAEAVGIDWETALLASRRRYLEVAWPLGPCSLEELAWSLQEQGLYAYTSMGFLVFGMHNGKGHALRWLLENTSLEPWTPSVGLGDSEPDRDFLEQVGTPILVPRGDRPLPRLSRSDWIPAPYPAPEGWVWAARMIAAGAIKPLRPRL
ncbi:MAG: hypothetical protein GSR78_05375 [Desulfurococcales archaeon]|nr:hypothetical protein [Desulfurococcales archaeon]